VNSGTKVHEFERRWSAYFDVGHTVTILPAGAIAPWWSTPA
jgi:hypothetical protein